MVHAPQAGVSEAHLARVRAGFVAADVFVGAGHCVRLVHRPRASLLARCPHRRKRWPICRACAKFSTMARHAMCGRYTYKLTLGENRQSLSAHLAG